MDLGEGPRAPPYFGQKKSPKEEKPAGQAKNWAPLISRSGIATDMYPVGLWKDFRCLLIILGLILNIIRYRFFLWLLHVRSFPLQSFGPIPCAQLSCRNREGSIHGFYFIETNYTDCRHVVSVLNAAVESSSNNNNKLRLQVLVRENFTF